MTTISLEITMSGFDDPKKQLNYATMKAINAVALDAQKAEREHIAQSFTIRRTSFANQAVKIKPFATKTSLSATIAIDPPGGHDVFSKFELGGEKQGRNGGLIAIPTSNVRKNVKTVIPTSKRPRQLTDAFKMNFPDGTAAIMQRRHYSSAKKSRLMMMYWLQKEVPIKPQLKFQETTSDMVRRMWNQRFNECWRQAYATAL